MNDRDPRKMALTGPAFSFAFYFLAVFAKASDRFSNTYGGEPG